SDLGHCGSCTTACPVGATCSNGTCACPAGTTACGGVCANTATDASHCGPTCVNCTNLPFVDAAHCANGTCVIDQCQYNWLDCNGDPLDGCEHLGLTC
ncbi:MAG: hypothetical protein M3065_14120, partial [Actinomycetota bacterium]|nr:hypothetical protein [Actinomycetota bacterium]